MRTIPSEDIQAAVAKLANEIAERHKESSRIVLAGIANGGIPVNDWLFESLKPQFKGELSKGVVDISFHRDDFGQKPITKEVEVTQLFHNPEDSIVILVDDVLHSGRTIRAALAELHALGRPQKVELAVLVDRGNRKLPIAPDYIGIVHETAVNEVVVVNIDASNHARSIIDIK